MLDFWLLKALFSKKGRDQVPIGCEASLQNDDMFFSYLENGNRYRIDRIKGSQISVIGYKEDTDNVVEHSEFSSRELKRKNISISHHYKLWRLEYTSLSEAFIKSRLGYNRLKWTIEASNDKKMYSYYQKHEILKLLIEHRDSSQVSFSKLKNILYGPTSALRTDYEQDIDLCWKLRALKDSGEIDFTDKTLYLEDITVQPQALNTLSDFERSEQESRNSKRMARTQQILSFLLVASAVVNIYFTHFSDS